MGRDMRIAIIGAGGRCVEKIYPSLKKLGGIEVSDIIDVLPEEEIRKRFSKGNLTDFNYYRTDGTANKLDDILEKLDVDAVIESTPNNFHTQDAIVVLGQNLDLYLEKPFAVNCSEMKDFEKVLERHPENCVYFGDYYRDEKGIALQVLTNIVQPDIAKKFLRDKNGEKIKPELYGAIDYLGKIKWIEGKILEGKGPASTVDHRLWLGDNSQGGMFRDLFYHLAAMSYLLGDKIGNIEVLESRAGICEEARRSYEKEVGEEIAETYTHSLLKSSEGYEIELRTGKYTGSHERYLHITGENGNLEIDFEKEELTIDTDRLRGSIINIPHTKYLLIMQQFKKLLDENPQHFMYENSKKALELTLSARGSVSKHFFYRKGEL